MSEPLKPVINLSQLGLKTIYLVGEKNALLGEMMKNLAKLYLEIPPEFATTTAYKKFLANNKIDKKIYNKLKKLAQKLKNQS